MVEERAREAALAISTMGKSCNRPMELQILLSMQELVEDQWLPQYVSMASWQSLDRMETVTMKVEMVIQVFRLKLKTLLYLWLI